MIELHPTIQFQGPAAAKKRDVNEAARHELAAAGVFWHRTYLKYHFAESAYQRYGGVFTPRMRYYVSRKGHAKPLVFSGDTREKALRQGAVRSTPKSARVTISVSSAINFGSGAHDYRAELTATNPMELMRLAKRVNTGVARRINLLAKSRRRTFA